VFETTLRHVYKNKLNLVCTLAADR